MHTFFLLNGLKRRLYANGHMCSAAEGVKIITAIVVVKRLFVLNMASRR